MTSDYKACPGCGQTLPLDSFAQRSGRPVGQRVSRCKECRYRQTAIWRSLNPTYHRQYTCAHPERALAYHERQVARLRALIATQSTSKPTS